MQVRGFSKHIGIDSPVNKQYLRKTCAYVSINSRKQNCWHLAESTRVCTETKSLVSLDSIWLKFREANFYKLDTNRNIYKSLL